MGGPLDLPFAKTIKVYEDVGDFSNDEDLTPSMIAFYRGVCGEEISKGKVFVSTRNVGGTCNNSCDFYTLGYCQKCFRKRTMVEKKRDRFFEAQTLVTVRENED
ncbi:hypothetical protein JHK84_050335 [Glycine max]|nr:hypothetical protein JHK84_050335 [Glycine max]